MICQREGCDKPVPKGRRCYCGPRCAADANRERANRQSHERVRKWRAFVAELFGGDDAPHDG